MALRDEMIDYKCMRCGHFMKFLAGTDTRISCEKCSSRIFMKPRRSGHKTLDAN